MEIRKGNVVLSNIPEQTGHEENVETTLNVTDTVSELIHNVLGVDDIQIIFANGVLIKMKNGGSNSSNPRIMMKLESQNQREKLLRIAKLLLQEERWNKFLLSPDFERIGHVDEMSVSEFRC